MGRDSGSAFKYERLKSNGNQIRLLRVVQPTNTDEVTGEEICCELSVWNLDDLPPYTAVSYTWGDPLNTRYMRLNGVKTSVRQNCWYVLMQSLSQQVQGYLWIDALCIDQQNDAEKSVQVAMMGSIYRNAAQVNVCLGPEGDGSGLLFKAIEAHAAFALSATGEPNVFGKRPREKAHTLTGAWFGKLSETQKCELWMALYHVSQRPYFNRVWVVQELLLAKCASLLCGTAAVEAQHFIYFYQDLMIHENDDMEEYRHFHGPKVIDLASRLDDITDRHGMWRDRSLLGLMHRFRSRECFDTRDKIYGLLALVDWQTRTPLLPDYSTTMMPLVLKVCLYIPASVNEPVEFFDPLRDSARLLKLFKFDFRHPEILTLLSRRQNILPYRSVVVNEETKDDRHRVEIPAYGYCTLSEGHQPDGILRACLGDMSPTRDRIEDFDAKRKFLIERHNLERDLKIKAWFNELPSSYIRAQNATGMIAILPQSTQAGDVLLNIREDGVGTAYGLVVRQSTQDHERYNFIGKAVLPIATATCYGGDLCSCCYAAEMHSKPGEQMMVCMDPEDMLVMVAHHKQTIKKRYDVQVLSQYLDTAVTRADDRGSSYVKMVSCDKAWVPMDESTQQVHNLRWWDHM